MAQSPVDQVPAEARVAARGTAGALVAGAVSLAGVLGLLVAEGRWRPLERLDTGVAARLHRAVAGHPAQVRTLRWLAVALEPNVFRALVGIAALVLWLRGWRRLAAWAVAVTAVGGLLGVLLKYAVARARPVLPDPVAAAGGYSFPSGHAVNSALCCGVLLVLAHRLLTRGPRDRRLWGAACLVAAVLVLVTGFDRVALGVHFVSDVVAGWFVAGTVIFGGLVAVRPERLTFRSRRHGGSAGA
jgi:membrane-associated phospholipid phosphatase